MKKLLFVLCVVLFSCEKDIYYPEPVFCWECWKDIVIPGSSFSVKIDICDASEREIREIEIANTAHYEFTTSVMTCEKKLK